LVVSLAPEVWVTAVGLAAIRGFGVAQAVANSGKVSVGKLSLLEQPTAAVSTNVATIVRELCIGPPVHDRAGLKKETALALEGLYYYYVARLTSSSRGTHMSR
jgi:hypothetical protein